MPSAVIERYLERAVPVPAAADGRPLRVAATLLTCEVAAALCNELKLPPERGSAYRYVNPHNPRRALVYDLRGKRWRAAAGFEEHPVWGVNWPGACLLCEGLGARLPTAAEWERFAAAGRPQRTYPWGDDPPDPTRANYDEHYGGTTPVARFGPNEAGLYDLAGNLSEWCQDAPEAGLACEKIVKGGAWSKDAGLLRIRATRAKWQRVGTTTIGLRPVWEAT